MSSPGELFVRLVRNASEGAASAPVVGAANLPDYVMANGSCVVYNGPVGMWDYEKASAKHFFDGIAMLLAFRLDEKREIVSFKKRFLKSEAFAKAQSHGRLITTEYGTPSAADPDKGLVSRLVSSLVPGEMTDNCACAVFQFNNNLTVAATETCLLRAVDPATLDTVGDKVDLSGAVNVASARARRDVGSRDVYNIASTFNSGIKYHFIRFPSDKLSSLSSQQDLSKCVEIHSTIPSRMTTCFSYYHSFAMTENYLIMVEQPWVANSLKLLASKIQGLSFKDCLEWHPKERNRFHLVEKKTGRLVKTVYLTADPFFFLNFVNAFEEEGGRQIVVDMVAYDSPDILDQMYLDKLRDPNGPTPPKDAGTITRFVLPLAASEEQEEKLECFAEGEELVKGNHGGVSAKREKKTILLTGRRSKEEGGCEHPVVNPTLVGRPYRFCYVVGWLHLTGAFANAVSKVDADSGEVSSAWRGTAFQHPAEPVFVPNPNGNGKEDDGVLVTAVTDARPNERDFLLFLDARNMSELARASFDEDIPLVSHGAMINI